MSKKRDLVMNIEPYHCEIRRYEGGFTWTFLAPINGDFGRTKKINLKFERWWLGYLYQDLLKVLDEERAEVARLTKLLNAEDV